jgi:hypothetical protein
MGLERVWPYLQIVGTNCWNIGQAMMQACAMPFLVTLIVLSFSSF